VHLCRQKLEEKHDVITVAPMMALTSWLGGNNETELGGFEICGLMKD
jgi:hypothetical protein